MSSYRPITTEERPHVEALGQLLRSLRDEAGMTQSQLGTLATLKASMVSAIERGRRRTRRSTLERLVAALVAEHRREVVLDELVEAAGPALAPESDWAERVERRRAQRERRDLPAAIEAIKDALASAKRLSRLWPEGHPRHEFGVENVATLEQQLAELEAKATEMGNQAAGGRGPASDPRRPAWSAWQAAASELFGGRRGTISMSSLAPDVRARLDELKSAADAEAADQATTA